MFLLVVDNCIIALCDWCDWQPPAGSKSFGAGHSGVAHDVELIQEGWLHLRGVDSTIYKQVNLCAGCRALPPVSGSDPWRVEGKERVVHDPNGHMSTMLCYQVCFTTHMNAICISKYL